MKPVTIETVRERLSYLEGLNERGVGTAVSQQQFETACLRELLTLLDEQEAAEKRIAEHNFESRLLANADRDIKALRQRIAELEANQGKPVMFIDGDISQDDADKLAAVIREFNEDTETPAAKMARIIRENPHPTNMCDMPAAGIGVKGE